MDTSSRKSRLVRGFVLGSMLIVAQVLIAPIALAAPNVCERSSCGSIGCTSYGYYPSAAQACSSNIPLLRFETSAAANYYCNPPTSPSVFATYAVCWKQECPFGSSFDSATGECLRDQKLSCPSSVGNPIDVRNGNKVQKALDIRAGGLALVRHYLHTVGSNPAKPGDGRWSFSYTQTIQRRSTAYGSERHDVYVLNWDDNVSYIFRGTDTVGFNFSDWQVPDFLNVSRVELGNSQLGWIIQDHDLREYIFNASGLLVEIRNPGQDSIVVERTFDSSGTVVSQTMNNRSNGATLEYSFDELNQGKIKSAQLTRL